MGKGMAKGNGGVKVVNPMMGGGDFDPPDGEDDLDEPLSPTVNNSLDLADGVTSALGDAGEAAVQVRCTRALQAWKSWLLMRWFAQGTSKVLLLVQAFVTFFFAPIAFFWMFTVLTDIFATTKWPLFGIEVR